MLKICFQSRARLRRLNPCAKEFRFAYTVGPNVTVRTEYSLSNLIIIIIIKVFI